MTTRKDVVKVQLYAWKLYWPFALDPDYLKKFSGKMSSVNNVLDFDSLEQAKAYVESLDGMELMSDKTENDEKFGLCINMDYTMKRSIFHGLMYASIWNINNVDKYFLG